MDFIRSRNGIERLGKKATDRGLIEDLYLSFILEVTIARKMLPRPQGIKGSKHNSLNKRLFI